MRKNIYIITTGSILISLFVELFLLPTILHLSRFFEIDCIYKLFAEAVTFSFPRLYFFFIFSSLILSLHLLNEKIILRKRYLIAFVVFFSLVAGKFTSSSLGFYDYLITDNTPTYTKSTLLGTPRGIRGDEWATEKPLYFAQVMNKNDLTYFNKNLGFQGYDMVVSGFSPVKDILLITRPDLWGFLFLEKDYAFSFYWNLRLILLFMSVFEFIYIFAKKDAQFAFLSAVIVTFSPAIQWWLSQTLMIMVYSGLYFLVCYHNFFKHKGQSKFIMLTGMIFFSNIYLFTLYPAIQIPLGYIFLSLLVVITPLKKLTKKNILLLGIVLISNSLLLAHFMACSQDAIQIINNTTYPGTSRGWLPLKKDYDILSFVNVLTAFKPPHFLNQSEVSQFWNLLLFLPVISICLFLRKAKILIPLSVLGMSLILFIIARLPAYNFIRDIFLFKYTYPIRLTFAYGFGFLLSLLLFFPHLKQKELLCRKKAIIISFSLMIFLSYLFYLSPDTLLFYKNFRYGYFVLFVVTLIYMHIGYCFIRGGKTLSYGVWGLAIFSFFSTIFVNPIVSGTDSMFEKKILKEVQKINQNDEGRWMVSGNPTISNLISALGVARVSGTYYYPDMNMMSILDPKKEHISFYNQYAHLDMRLLENVSTSQVVYRSISGVNKVIFISPQMARQLGIKYIFTKETFPEEYTGHNKIKLLYKSSTQPWKIYKLI